VVGDLVRIVWIRSVVDGDDEHRRHAAARQRCGVDPSREQVPEGVVSRTRVGRPETVDVREVVRFDQGVDERHGPGGLVGLEHGADLGGEIAAREGAHPSSHVVATRFRCFASPHEGIVTSTDFVRRCEIFGSAIPSRILP
jgi:hypothetical protein